ncbi:hypothetical protein MBANPS3_002766 [Mucor bainieri]
MDATLRYYQDTQHCMIRELIIKKLEVLGSSSTLAASTAKPEPTQEPRHDHSSVSSSGNAAAINLDANVTLISNVVHKTEWQIKALVTTKSEIRTKLNG